jgi:hypothetical protein
VHVFAERQEQKNGRRLNYKLAPFADWQTLLFFIMYYFGVRPKGKLKLLSNFEHTLQMQL